MRLSVVIVTWNEREEILRAVGAARSNPPHGGLEIIVVDNGSTDGSAEAVAELAPEARIIRSDVNRGLTVARNIGMSHARGRYIGMLDSDAFVRAGALETLCSVLDADPSAGLVGPRLVYEDGRLQLSCRRIPSPVALAASRVAPIRRIAPRGYARYLMKDFDHRTMREVDYVLGATMVFRREVAARIGPFDERYGFSTPGGYGFDDADWALRVRRLGYRVLYVPEAVVEHRYRRRLARNQLNLANVALGASYGLLLLKHGPFLLSTAAARS